MDAQMESRKAGRRLLAYLLTFAAVVLSVNIFFATRAIKTHTGEVTDHAYETGLRYNSVLEEAKKNEALGWQADITVAKGSASSADALTIRVTDAQRQPVDLLACDVALRRPLNARQDFTPSFTVREKGVCSSMVTFPEKGQWEIHATLKDKNHTVFHKVERLRVE